MLPCIRDNTVGLTELMATLWASTTPGGDGRRPVAWKAHFLGEFSAMFSGPQGRAFLHEHEVGG
jgi:hypothetical protein